ncbi:ABSCISIC ACID-INSENSITIVE 5-like protein 3 [Wolffia australiana]
MDKSRPSDPTRGADPSTRSQRGVFRVCHGREKYVTVFEYPCKGRVCRPDERLGCCHVASEFETTGLGFYCKWADRLAHNGSCWGFPTGEQTNESVERSCRRSRLQIGLSIDHSAESSIGEYFPDRRYPNAWYLSREISVDSMGIQSVVFHGVDGPELQAGEVQNQLGQPMNGMNFEEILSNSGLDSQRSFDQRQRKGNGERVQTTEGEMTLEDFLVKVGVVVKATEKGASNVSSTASSDPVFSTGGEWNRQRMSAVYSDPQLTFSSPALAKQESSCEFGEMIVGRRQKRMIKNRESAARSRARKQAYTNELENKVSHLEEENRMLKKRKEFEIILQNLSNPGPRFRLRRTSSAPP